MYCSNCGNMIDDSSFFCEFCGASTNGNKKNLFNEASPKIVPAKCTNCGAPLEVNPKESAAICPYCKSAYIVDQAIKEYNVSMSGNINVGNAVINVGENNIDNLIKRAQEFESNSEFQKAIQYYDRVLDSDIANAPAKEGIDRVNRCVFLLKNANKAEKSYAYNSAMHFFDEILGIYPNNRNAITGKQRVRMKIENYIYFSTNGYYSDSIILTEWTEGLIILKKGLLLFRSKNNNLHQLCAMSEVREIKPVLSLSGYSYAANYNRVIQIKHSGNKVLKIRPHRQNFDKCLQLLKDAAQGNYPPFK